MATLQWIGGGNNNATNPADWSPYGVPQPNETLVISGGTLNIRSAVLAGDTLHVHAPTGGGSVAAPVINVFNGGSVNLLLDPPVESTSDPTVNVTGTAQVNATLLGSPENGVQLTENIANASVLVGSVQVNRGVVTIQGAGTFKVQGTSTFSNDTAKITTAMVGNGVITVDQGSLELSGPVAAGPAFQLLNDGALTIDDLATFKATVTDTSTGFLNEDINLTGISATSYAYAKNVLQLFNGNTLVGSLNLQAGKGTVYAVQGKTGVVVEDTSASTPPSGALPLHAATQSAMLATADSWSAILGAHTNSAVLTPQDFSANLATESLSPSWHAGPRSVDLATPTVNTGLHMFSHPGT